MSLDAGTYKKLQNRLRSLTETHIPRQQSHVTITEEQLLAELDDLKAFKTEAKALKTMLKSVGELPEDLQ